MKGLMSVVLFLFLASGSAIAADAPEPAPSAAPGPVQGSAASTTRAHDASAELAALRTENETLRTENEMLKITVRGQLKTITALNKQIADLKASNAAALARSQAPASPVDDIKKAIAEHRLIKGMTVADAESALGVKLKQMQDSSDGTIYIAIITDKAKPNPNTGAQVFGTEYNIYVREGVISSWQSERYFIGNDGRSYTIGTDGVARPNR